MSRFPIEDMKLLFRDYALYSSASNDIVEHPIDKKRSFARFKDDEPENEDVPSRTGKLRHQTSDQRVDSGNVTENPKKKRSRSKSSSNDKPKRASMIDLVLFRQALKNWASNAGSDLSVDNAKIFINKYHKDRPEENLPAPPTSRATVHRWLKVCDIELGPRGKKKK